MLKKLILSIIVTCAYQLAAQDVTIFFLKDGSIIQGKIVNENQHRIFLKTEQGTIKILPADILGREDTAKKGDLTFMSERLEYLQGNVNHLSGQVNHLNDSLRSALEDLHNVFMNLEALQNEFEIDLLRLHSQGREQKKKIEYFQDDLVNQKVEIASNRQEMGGIDDTVSTLNQQFYKVKEKLNATANQSYLLTGNLSTIKRDIQSLVNSQDNHQNQINMMSGALANNIQEVIRVQGRFSEVEDGVDNNLIGIKELNKSLDVKIDDLTQKMDFMFSSLNEKLDGINNTIEELDKNASKARKKITIDIGDLTNELGILNEKVTNLSRELRVTDEKLSTTDDKVIAMENNINSIKNNINSIDKNIIAIEENINTIESSSKVMDNKIKKLKVKVEDIPLPEK